ncbi:MAG: LysR family transcriptional regulator [Clostridia bacterium]|nr:LysR family transcriptional regulator [Clostridia bacterium]
MKIFEAVCGCGCNTTKAAEQLHMTQPAVSLAISELENYYCVRLFDRISRRLYLSEAGRRFREYSRSISLTFDDMEKTVREWEKNGVIRVGASISIGSMLLPEYAAQFRVTHPDTTVRVKVDRSDRLEQATLRNELDVALMEGIAHDENLVSEDFMEDSLAVIASSERFENGTVIAPDEFLRMDFLLREHGSGTREVFDSTLAALEYPLPEPAWESLSTAALMNAACAGLGVAIIPKRMADEKIAGGHVAQLFVDGIEFRRKYKIVYHKNKHLTSAALDFLDLCRTFGGRNNDLA